VAAIVLCVLLAGLQVGSNANPPPSVSLVAISALVLYLSLILAVFLLERPLQTTDSGR
jgi:hypothetical protein